MKPPPKPRIPSGHPPARPLSKEQYLHFKAHFEYALKKTADELRAAATPEERLALRFRCNDITEIIYDIDNGDMSPAYLAHCIARISNDETFRSTVKLAARSFDTESTDANKTLAQAQSDTRHSRQMKAGARSARNDELSKILEREYLSLIKSGNPKPTWREVAAALISGYETEQDLIAKTQVMGGQKIKEKYKAIQEIDCDGEVIRWRTPRGKELETEFDSIPDRMTKIKKKLLHK